MKSAQRAGAVAPYGPGPAAPGKSCLRRPFLGRGQTVAHHTLKKCASGPAHGLTPAQEGKSYGNLSMRDYITCMRLVAARVFEMPRPGSGGASLDLPEIICTFGHAGVVRPLSPWEGDVFSGPRIARPSSASVKPPAAAPSLRYGPPGDAGPGRAKGPT